VSGTGTELVVESLRLSRSTRSTARLYSFGNGWWGTAKMSSPATLGWTSLSGGTPRSRVTPPTVVHIIRLLPSACSCLYATPVAPAPSRTVCGGR
jgi:hypothetical protein